MDLLKQPPTMTLPAERFTSDAYADVIHRGGNVIETHPEDVIHTPPSDQHCHGAAPDQFMTHLTPWETDDATWLEHVSDDEYNGPRANARTRP
ncbi:MAG: hypothetical protein WCD21_34375 [Streptomyces sp.]